MNKLVEVSKKALDEMCRVVAPDNHFTDVVDELDAAITEAEAAQHRMHQAFGVLLVVFFIGFGIGAVVFNGLCGGW